MKSVSKRTLVGKLPKEYVLATLAAGHSLSACLLEHWKSVKETFETWLPVDVPVETAYRFHSGVSEMSLSELVSAGRKGYGRAIVSRIPTTDEYLIEAIDHHLWLAEHNI